MYFIYDSNLPINRHYLKIKPQIVQAVYESKPMLSDHKTKGGEFSNKEFIG